MLPPSTNGLSLTDALPTSSVQRTSASTSSSYRKGTCRRAHLPHPPLWDPVFLQRTLKRPWPVCALVRPRKSHKRPVVLSLHEVRDHLGLVEHPTTQLCLRLIYACGLRLTKGRICKSPISTPPACWFECATARGAKTAWCHWPTGPSNACKCIGTAKVLPLVVPGPQPASASPGGHAPEDLHNLLIPSKRSPPSAPLPWDAA